MVVLLVVLVCLFAALYYVAPIWGTACAEGSAVATEGLWTPTMLVDQPPNTTAWASTNIPPGPTYDFSSGSFQSSSPVFVPPTQPGSGARGSEHLGWGSWGDFVWVNWTMYAVHNVSVTGGAATGACTQRYVAVLAAVRWGSLGSSTWPQANIWLPNNASDVGVADHPEGLSPSVGFDLAVNLAAPSTGQDETPFSASEPGQVSYGPAGAMAVGVEVDLNGSGTSYVSTGVLQWAGSGAGGTLTDTLGSGIFLDFSGTGTYCPQDIGVNGAPGPLAFVYYATGWSSGSGACP